MRYFNLNGPIVRERDIRGQLTAAGYCWAERFEDILPALAGPSAIAIVIGVAQLFNHTATWMTALGPIIFGCIGLPLSVWFSVLERAVIFERNGRIAFPHGTFGSFWKRAFYRPHQDIASIEVTPQNYHGRSRFSVALFTVHGETWIVSGNLSNAQARLVAVQLTRALKELRDSMATLSTVTASPQPRHKAPAWIE